MLRHKKRIGLITLVVFTLLTVLSGAAMAAKTPAEKQAVVKPATVATGGGTGGGADPGERVENDTWNKDVYLTSLTVSQDGLLYEAPTEDKYNGEYVTQLNHYVGATAGNITIAATRDNNTSDFMGYSFDGNSYTWYSAGQPTQFSVTTAISGEINKVYIKVGELNDEGRSPGSGNIKKSSTYIITIDTRTISLDPTSMTLRARRAPGTIVATISDGEEYGVYSQYTANCAETPDITWSTDRPDLIDLDSEGVICNVTPLKKGTAIVTATLSNGASASCTVTIRGVRTQEEQEQPERAPAALPETPEPPALETYDVTITVGSNQAIVDGEIVELSGNALLFGEDRVMIDYADMAKLIPGLEVTWD